MANIFMISVSGYYHWLKRTPTVRQMKRRQAVLLVRTAHEETRRSYGVSRLQKHIQNKGVHLSTYLIRTIRTEEGIRCKQHKRYQVTTKSDHNKPVYANLLDQNFTVSCPNEVWVSDITYIWTEEGWLYLAGVKDLYSKELLGYCLDSRMKSILCVKALKMAILRRSPSKGLLVHSDQGSQYCSDVYRKFLGKQNFIGSMSRRGNCYDNAPIESFWGTLKNELIYHKRYQTRQQATNDIIQYIEIFYNRMRIQAGLKFKSPAMVWRDFYQVAA